MKKNNLKIIYFFYNIKKLFIINILKKYDFPAFGKPTRDVVAIVLISNS